LKYFGPIRSTDEVPSLDDPESPMSIRLSEVVISGLSPFPVSFEGREDEFEVDLDTVSTS
jgi:hypothetical protein